MCEEIEFSSLVEQTSQLIDEAVRDAGRSFEFIEPDPSQVIEEGKRFLLKGQLLCKHDQEKILQGLDKQTLIDVYKKLREQYDIVSHDYASLSFQISLRGLGPEKTRWFGG